MQNFANRIIYFALVTLIFAATSALAQTQQPWQTQQKFYVQSAVGGKYLDVQWSNPNLGAPLHLWDFNGGVAQKWTFIPSGEYFFIKSEFGTYLDVQWSGTDIGTPVHTWEFNGGDAQKWKLIPVGNDFFLIQSKLGNYLDVQWGNSASGTPIWTWNHNAGNAQKWKLMKVPTSGIGVSTQALSGSAGAKWPENVINVCWENPATENDLQREIVRLAVLGSWEANSAVRFYGWGRCGGYESGIRIKISDEIPHVKTLGVGLSGMRDGMVLNFTFRNFCPNCGGGNYWNSVRSTAIHEFGHALSFSHEHQRRDCYFNCDDAPQGQTGDWNITECDADSIMNYCFNSGYNGRLSYLDIQGVQAMYGSANYTTPEIREFRPQTIGPFCPTAVLSGDRNFGGNGPRMHTSVTLRISADQQHLEAVIDFHAIEAGGDRSATAGQWVRRVWSAESGKRITGIMSNTYSEANFTGAGAGPEFWGCNDGGVHNPPVEAGNLVRVFHIIGDTGGDDISSDENCHCDTQIRAIEFNSVRIRVEPKPTQ